MLDWNIYALTIVLEPHRKGRIETIRYWNADIDDRKDVLINRDWNPYIPPPSACFHLQAK